MLDLKIGAKRDEAQSLRAKADAIDRECDNMERQRKRAIAEGHGQLWLGKFIELLKSMPAGAFVEFENGMPVNHWHSYRGDYADLAIDSWPITSPRTVTQALRQAEEAKHLPFEGWKGGEFWMDDDTILWRWRMAWAAHHRRRIARWEMRGSDRATMLVQVTAPHFCAGLVMRDERCVEAAPILAWARGKSRDELRAYFARRKWRAVMVREKENG